jgi:hypothetical protein
MSALDQYLTHATIASEHEPQETTPLPVLSDKAKADNLRRLKYAVFITEHPDGTRSFKHDPGVIRDGLIFSTAADRGAHEAIPAGSGGYGDGQAAPSTGPARDASGKFASREKA